MKRAEVLDKTVSDFDTFLYDNEVAEYKKNISEFISANETLPDEEFYGKFEKQFASARLLNQAFSRIYLSRIASSVNTIKVIVIIYLVASIIAGLYIGSQLP